MTILIIQIVLLLGLIPILIYEVMLMIEFIRIARGDVPFVPSTTAIIKTAIDANVLPKEGTILDLGCGDGKALRMLSVAGYRGPLIGYERAPFPWTLGWFACLWHNRRNPSFARVDLRRQDFKHAPLEEARGMYLFLLKEVVAELAPTLAKRLRPGTPVVSAEFEITGWIPENVLIAKGITSKEARVFFYRVP